MIKFPLKKRYSGGWNISTVSRILKNEKYTGLWIWRKWKVIRDPMSGRKKQFIRPKEEQMPIFKENLVIIDKETWDKTEKRWSEIEGTWPLNKRNKKENIKRKSYVHSHPTHLLAGLMKCDCCGGAIVLLSGKNGGYYGCYNAKRKTCDNTLMVPRKLAEKDIIEGLKRALTTKNLEYVYKNLEKVVAKGLNDVPELIKKKKLQYEKILSEMNNYLNYIKS
ncbi:MAG: recombinase family protein [Candidatus Omnitrophota bacterium]